jgi:hypothetical protein
MVQILLPLLILKSPDKGFNIVDTGTNVTDVHSFKGSGARHFTEYESRFLGGKADEI